MKVRWTASSLRLRITPPELAALQQREPVVENLCLPGGATPAWAVILQPVESEADLSASAGTIQFNLPIADIERLSEPDREGLYFHRYGPVDDLHGFSFYVEKDFPCVHPRPSETKERQTETFTAP